MERSTIFRTVCVLVVFSMLFQSCFAAVATIAETASTAIRLALQTEPPDYTELPPIDNIGSDPARDEIYQNGIWDSGTIETLGYLEENQQSNSDMPITDEPYVPEENVPPDTPGFEEKLAKRRMLPRSVQMVMLALANMGYQLADEAQFGPAGGTAAHMAFKAGAKQMATKLPSGYGLATEASFNSGRAANYGEKGSKRIDVGLQFNGIFLAILDLKTGGARLTKNRAQELISNVPNNPPLTEIPRRFKGPIIGFGMGVGM